MSGSRRLLIAGLALAAMLVAFPAAASADNRYASPTGSGSVCDLGSPCSIETAINDATAGDDITLTAGTYPTTSTLGEADCPGTCTLIDNLTIHGSPGARPVINFGESLSDVNGIFLSGTTPALRDVIVNFDSVNGSAITVLGGTIERVTSHVLHHDSTSASSACALGGNVTVRDSLCWNSAPGTDANANALAMFATAASRTVTIRNVTAIADDPGPSGPPALIGLVGSAGSLTVNATNVIARSATGTDVSMLPQGTPTNPHGTLTLDHSNYATHADDSGNDLNVVDGGSNQTTAPVFVDAANGDFREAVASTGTIDLGTSTGLLGGELDIDGLARSQGAAPDIGAHEFVPQVTPPPTTSPPASSAAPTTKKKCKKGFVLKKVKGKKKCVRKKRR